MNTSNLVTAHEIINNIVSAYTGEMAKRYGQIYVNRNDDGTGDFSRIKKDSFFWYKKVIASNGKDLTY